MVCTLYLEAELELTIFFQFEEIIFLSYFLAKKYFFFSIFYFLSDIPSI